MILIAPYAKPLRNGMPNPKDYPYWPALVAELQRIDHVVQIGVTGESALVQDVRFDRTLQELTAFLLECIFWVSVDSFLPHLAHHLPKSGVVLWGPSDPKIFGYPENLNLLKDRRYVRPKQFRVWEEQTATPDAFLSPDAVMQQLQAWRPAPMVAEEYQYGDVYAESAH